MMNKYVKPEIKVVELNLDAPLLAASGDSKSLSTSDVSTGNASDGLSRETPAFDVWGGEEEN